MMRMKHLLKKLHIGGGGTATGGSSLDDIRNPPKLSPLRPSSSSSAAAAGSTSSVTTGATTSSSSRGRGATDGAGGSRSRGMEIPDSLEMVPSLGGGRGSAVDGGSALVVVPAKPPQDFCLFEEEYQVQLALAISVSDPDGREDPESAQINAAKRMSLGCTPVAASGVGGSDNLVEILSQRYWNFNILNYDEKVMDGFYDVYGIIHSSLQEKMPLFVDLQSTSISENVDYEVVLVNRTTDHALQQLERRALSISKQCGARELGSHSGIIQKLADLVADSMGGPVCDADDMLRRWTSKSYELRNSLNTIVLPLGCLKVGLSRHRALLFKVLADRIDLPCKLVKGSYYTGTDEGAVNLIKMDHEREFIIDLMGAPGVLIPAEIPSCHLQNAEFDLVNSNHITQTVKDLSVALDSNTNWQLDGYMNRSERSSNDPTFASESVAFVSEESTRKGTSMTEDNVTCEERNNTEKIEHDCGKILSSSTKVLRTTCGINEPKTPSFQMKVTDVSKYVVSAAKDPEFAQKLQAVLLESGPSPPPDLFSCISSFDNTRDQKDPSQVLEINEENNLHREALSPHVEDSFLPFFESSPCYGSESNFLMLNPLGARGVNEDKSSEFSASSSSDAIKSKGTQIHDAGDGSLLEVGNAISGASQTVARKISKEEERKAVLDDVAECEIPWKDLQIGERIGIGSYGEVYHADWNGTEVAVKKFLDQDLSGDALEQFRCEIKIMLRLRHPNVVLFMGAVTRPPNLSILTEFLPRGSLYRLLHRPKSQIDEKRRIKMALDVAKGMNYLHTSHPTIVHRDLKSPNLLVDKNWVVKVCDFGLSRLKHHTFLSSKSTAGTPEWMAPEVLRNERSNEKCDVYSFGVILWELATLRVPWNGMNPMQVVGAVGFQNRRLDIPKEVDPPAAKIICNCWHNEPNQRPSFAQLMNPLRELQRLIVEDP